MPPSTETVVRQPKLGGELKDTLWWSADVNRFSFPRRWKTYSQRIGLIVSDDLLYSVEPECPVQVLTKVNWRLVISLKAVDLILFEPCLRDAAHSWGRTLFDSEGICSEFKEFLKSARAAGIPTICFIRSDEAFFGIQSGFAPLFEKTFCTDARFCDRLRKAGVDAEHLPMAVQPSIFNPFVELEDPKLNTPELLFDGFPSLVNVPALASEIKKLVPFGLHIPESNATVRRHRMLEDPDLAPSVLGCVTPRNRLFLLKRAKVLVQSKDDITPRQQAEKLALEAAACRTVILHHGALDEHDMRRHFAHSFENWDDLRRFLSQLQLDQILWMREAQRAWRTAHLNFSMDKALAKILRGVGFDVPNGRIPKATIVTPTYRPDKLQKTVNQYRAQSWPNKELIVVANTNDESPWDKSLLDHSNGEQIVFLPRSHWAGSALNIGALRSTGCYVFRVDDDDYYGENYILDLCLHANSCDPDFFGKQAAFVYFDEHKKVFWRTSKSCLPTVFLSKEFSYGKTGIAGFTVSSTSTIMRERGYPDEAFGFADSALFERERNYQTRIAVCDPLNAVFERRSDPTTHTWRYQMDCSEADMLEIGGRPDEVFV